MSFLRINRNTTELFGKEQRQSLTLYSPRPLTRKILPQAAGRISDGIALPASLTVEAALALTLFLLAVSCFWGLFPAMQLSLELQAALEQTTEEMAAAAYGVGKLSGTGESGEDAGELLQLAAGGVSLVYAHQRVIQLVGAERLEESCVWGGSGGLSFLGSSVLEEERVDLRVSYRVRLPFSVGPVGSLAVSQRSCRRAWTGQLAAEGGEEAETSGTRVYVTENGSVYHTTLDCTYLNLSVTAVFRAQASITISASKDTVGSSGDNVTFTASVSGNRGDKTVVWQLNGQTISNKTGDSVTLNVIPGDKVSAVIGDTVSNTITIKQSQSLSIKAGQLSCRFRSPAGTR